MTHGTGALLLIAVIMVLAVSYPAAAQGILPAATPLPGVSNETPLIFLGNENLAPIVYLDGTTPSGVDVDIVKALAPHLSRPVEIRAMNWSEAQALVARGDADALIQINPTEERLKVYDFSDPILQSQFSIFTRADRLGIAGASSLEGLRVGVELGGLPAQVLGEDPRIQLVTIPTFADGFRQLNGGSLDAVVVDYRVGSYVLAVNNIQNIRVAGDPVAFSNASIAVKKGNTALLNEINAGLRSIRADGTYQKVLDNWEPTVGIFETRQQIAEGTYRIAIIILVILFLIAVFWIVTVRRELGRRKAAEAEAASSKRIEEETGAQNEELVAINEELTATQEELRQNLDKLARSEQAVRESEQKYHRLFANMTEEVHYWEIVRDDAGGIRTWRLVDANAPALRTWGKILDEIRGKTTDEIFGPGATEHYMPVVQKIMTENVPYTYEDYFGHLDKYFRFTSVPLGTHFLTTGADITGIRKATEALRVSEERLRSLYSSMTEGVAVHELVRDAAGKPADYRIIEVNPAFSAITGISREQAVGALASGLYGSREPPFLDTFARVAETGLAEEFETGFAPMQKSFHISVFSPARGRFATVFSDITGRKEAEDALQRAHDELELRVLKRTAELRTALETIGTERRRLYDVLETLPAYVCLLDKDYRMPFANRYFRETFGYSDTRPCHDFLFGLEKPCDTCESYTVMRTKAPHHWYWTGPNNHDYDIYDFPFTDADGSFLILEMGIDITERNKAQAALTKARDELEQRVLERTAELAGRNRELFAANEQLSTLNEELVSTKEELQRKVGELAQGEQILRQSAAELKEALDEKEVLLSEIHHRVKNNLTAFISLLSLEGAYDDSPAGLALKKDLENRARSMALIHETLYRTHRYSSVDMEVYLSTLVEQIAKSYESVTPVKTVVEAHGITLDLTRATPAGLIINELVTNSLKYAFPASHDCEAVRGRPCTIRVRLTKDDGVYVLAVSDNGIGLPGNFDIATTKTLGLKLVNFLARHQLRATIGVNQDGGTVFAFTFRDTMK